MTDEERKRLAQKLMDGTDPVKAQNRVRIADLFGGLMGGSPFGAQPVSPPRPAKVTIDVSDRARFVAVGMAKALAYAEKGWTPVAVVKSNEKPIAAVLEWARDGEPVTP